MKIPELPPSIESLLARASEMFVPVTDPSFREAVQEATDRHLHWDKLKFMARGRGCNPESVWFSVKLARFGQYRPLPLRGAVGKSLVYMHTDRMLRHLMLIDQELAGRVVSDGPSSFHIEPQQSEQYILGVLRDEAIASSMLEGASTTRAVARKMLRSGRRPRTHGEWMVYNNYQAIQFIREHKRTDLSMELLLRLQTLLTENTLEEDDQVGRLRVDADNVQVIDRATGEVLHEPPPASELPARMRMLCDFANAPLSDKGKFIHPVLKACILHFQIGFDHPFCDGNGRTARALFYWYMLRSGYWLFEYLPISKFIYKSPVKYGKSYLYTETDDFDVTYFLHYHMDVIGKARTELGEHLRRRQERAMEARRLLTNDPTLNIRQQELLLESARNQSRVFTVEEHQLKHGVSYETARKDLLTLADGDYLEKRKEGKKWVFIPGEKMNQVVEQQSRQTKR